MVPQTYELSFGLSIVVVFMCLIFIVLVLNICVYIIKCICRQLIKLFSNDGSVDASSIDEPDPLSSTQDEIAFNTQIQKEKTVKNKDLPSRKEDVIKSKQEISHSSIEAIKRKGKSKKKI